MRLVLLELCKIVYNNLFLTHDFVTNQSVSQSPPGGAKTEAAGLLECDLSVAGLNEKERRVVRTHLVMSESRDRAK